MTRQKKLFAAFAAIFVLFLIYVSVDISRRTTFPGSRPQLRERLMNEPVAPDTLRGDSVDAPTDSADVVGRNPDIP